MFPNPNRYRSSGRDRQAANNPFAAYAGSLLSSSIHRPSSSNAGVRAIGPAGASERQQSAEGLIVDVNPLVSGIANPSSLPLFNSEDERFLSERNAMLMLNQFNLNDNRSGNLPSNQTASQIGFHLSEADLTSELSREYQEYLEAIGNRAERRTVLTYVEFVLYYKSQSESSNRTVEEIFSSQRTQSCEMSMATPIEGVQVQNSPQITFGDLSFTPHQSTSENLINLSSKNNAVTSIEVDTPEEVVSGSAAVSGSGNQGRHSVPSARFGGCRPTNATGESRGCSTVPWVSARESSDLAMRPAKPPIQGKPEVQGITASTSIFSWSASSATCTGSVALVAASGDRVWVTCTFS